MTPFLNKNQVSCICKTNKFNSAYTFIIPGTFTRTISANKNSLMNSNASNPQGVCQRLKLRWDSTRGKASPAIERRICLMFFFFFKRIFFLAECPGVFFWISHFLSLFLDYAHFVHQEKMRREGYMLLTPCFFLQNETNPFDTGEMSKKWSA